MFSHLLSNGCSSSELASSDQLVDASGRKFTFERAWRTRCSEIHVAASRAENSSNAAKKLLVLADTTLFSEIKEPKEELQVGLEFTRALRACCKVYNQIPAHVFRQLLAFSGLVCHAHAEQCTLAEYCAYKARDVLAHIDLAAAARQKFSVRGRVSAESDVDEGSDDDANRQRQNFLKFQDKLPLILL